MCSDEGDWTCLQPGFPIRASSDHSLVIDSPRLIADSYALHRFLVPRHPPCALKNLSHKDARVHCAVLKKRAAPHPTGAYHPPHHPGPPQGSNPRKGDGVRRGGSTAVRVPAEPASHRPRPEGPRACRPSLQDPTTCQAPDPTPTRVPRPWRTRARTNAPRRCRRQLIDVPPLSTRCPTLGDRPGSGSLARPALLRKEVIQPHLPVRLPCYDLVPIASPTFDGSPSCELGHRLRVLPTFVT